MKKLILSIGIVLLLLAAVPMLAACKKDDEQPDGNLGETTDAFGFERPDDVWLSDSLLLSSEPNLAELIGTGGESGLLSDAAQQKNGVGLKPGQTSYLVYLFYGRMSYEVKISVNDFQFKLVNDTRVTYDKDCVNVGNAKAYTSGATVALDMSKAASSRMAVTLSTTSTTTGDRWIHQGAIVIPFTVKESGTLYIDFALRDNLNAESSQESRAAYLCADVSDLSMAGCNVNVHGFSVGYLSKDVYESGNYTDADIKTEFSFGDDGFSYMVLDLTYSAATDNDGTLQLNVLANMRGRGYLDVTIDAAPTGKVGEEKNVAGIAIYASFNVPQKAGEQKSVRVVLRLLSIGNATTELDLFLSGDARIKVLNDTYLTQNVYTQSTSLLNYKINADGESYTVIGISDKDVTSVVIPEKREDGCPVTAIGASAFSKCSSLQKITVPSSITSVGNSAFYQCTALSYTMYQNGKYLGNKENPYVVFMGVIDKNVTAFALSDESTVIYDSAFAECTALTAVTLPQSVTSIGASAFSECTSLMNIVIPKGVSCINDDTFSGCTSLASVMMSEGVASIGQGAFNGCGALTDIFLPSTVMSIDYSAFSGCGKIVYTVYENGKYLGSETNPYLLFKGVTDTAVTDFRIPDGTRFIWSYALEACSALTSITIPSGVLTIGRSAFSGCVGLTSVTIPASVESIESDAFYGCTALQGVYITDLTAWCKEGLFKKDIGSSYEPYSNPLRYAKRLYLNGNLVTDLVIPDGVTTIGRYAFMGGESITSVSIPSSVSAIGYRTFEGCIGLTSLVIPDGVVDIGASFGDCTGLVSITIPSTLSKCYGDSLVDWGESNYVSSFRGCKNLAEVHITNLAAWCEIDFGCISANNPLYYADHLYLNGNLITDMVVPSEATEIGRMAFNGYSALTSVTIPAGVESIGYGAFGLCSNLKSVTLPAGLKTIGKNAFRDCQSLSEITVPFSVTKIESYAFYGCKNLEAATFESTSGWTYGATGAAAKKISWQNARTAASYLKGEYCGEIWYRS